MVSCAACGRSLTVRNKSLGITFHSFPKDAQRRQVWVNFVKKPEWIPRRTNVLCSNHFAEECIDRTAPQKVRLFSTALPTIEVNRLKPVKKLHPGRQKPRENVTLEVPKSENLPPTDYDPLADAFELIRTPPFALDVTIKQEMEEDTPEEIHLKQNAFETPSNGTENQNNIKNDKENYTSEAKSKNDVRKWGIEENANTMLLCKVNDSTGQEEQEGVCRTCLKVFSIEKTVVICNGSQNTPQNGFVSLKEKLHDIQPYIDFDLTEKPVVVCRTCENSIHRCYDFKQLCRFSEMKLRHATRLTKRPILDLLKIDDLPPLSEVDEHMLAPRITAEETKKKEITNEKITLEDVLVRITHDVITDEVIQGVINDKITEEIARDVIITDQITRGALNDELISQPVKKINWVEEVNLSDVEDGWQWDTIRCDPLTKSNSNRLEENPNRLNENANRLEENPNRLKENPNRLNENPNHLEENPNHLEENPNHLEENPNRLEENPNGLKGYPKCDKNLKSLPKLKNWIINFDYWKGRELDVLSEEFGDYLRYRGGKELEARVLRRLKMLKNPVNGGSPVVCEFCGCIYETFKKYRFHAKVRHGKAKKKVCPMCGKTVVGPYFSRHIRNNHPMKQKTSLHICHKCGKCFPKYRSLTLHIRTHEIREKKFQCTVCYKKYHRRHHLRAHQQRNHAIARSTLSKQEVREPQKREMRQHLLKHEMKQQLQKHDIKATWKCYICNKIFKHQRSVEEHIKAHVNDNKYKCDLCPESFRKKITLEIHKNKIHLNVNFKCKYCKNKFYTQLNLDKHLANVHRKKVHINFRCNKCNRGYVKEKRCRQHLITKHGISPEEAATYVQTLLSDDEKLTEGVNSKENCHDTADKSSYDVEETCKDTRETFKDSREACKDTTETCKDIRETFKDTREACKGTTETCKDTRETFKDRREACKDTTETCKDIRETFKDTREACKGTTETCKDTRETCKDTRETFKDTREACKDTTETCKDTRETFKDTGEACKNTTETCKDTRETFKDTRKACKDTTETCKDTRATFKDTREACKDTTETCKDTRETFKDTREVCKDTTETCKDTRETCQVTKETCQNIKAESHHDIKQENCHIMEEDCHMMEEDCHMMEEDCHIMEKNCHMMEEDCHMIEKDCHMMEEDCQMMEEESWNGIKEESFHEIKAENVYDIKEESSLNVKQESHLEEESYHVKIEEGLVERTGPWLSSKIVP